MNFLCFSEYFDSTEEAWSFFAHALPGVFSETATELQGVFSNVELEAIIMAMRNVELVPHAAGNIVYQECVDMLRFQWVAIRRKINTIEFLKKINELTSFQSLFLEIWAKRYWDIVSEGTEFSIYHYVWTLEKSEMAYAN